jgi:osmotically-inducible protein OsmY
MARLLFVVAVAAAAGVSVGCGTNTASQERERETPAPHTVALKRQRQTPARAEAPRSVAAAIAVPDNLADRGIRRDLNLAIAHDADLQNREISFIVANGDVSVIGTVRSEDERRKINDLAMSIDGVRSVANALRVAE